MSLSAKSLALAISLAIALYGGASAGPGLPGDNPLRVQMSAAPANARGFVGAIDIAITNYGNRPLRLSKWELPSGYRDRVLFEVTRNGQPVTYLGRILELGPLPASDYVSIKPGETLRSTVDLSDAYDLRKSGDYVVTMRSPLHHARDGQGRRMLQADGLPAAMTSRPLRLWVDGADLIGAIDASALRKPARDTELTAQAVEQYLGVTYTGCTVERRNQASTAILNARLLNVDVLSHFTLNLLNGSTPRYVKWYGAHTPARYDTVKTNHSKISTAFLQSAGQINIDCSCSLGTSNTYAYVYPAFPYTIYVCALFWPQPQVGTNTKAGTLIHEMSHFGVVAGTDDIAYGITGARNLAISNPAYAIRNAENYLFFAENPYAD